ncbi:exosome 3'-_5 exonuclease subunit ski4 (Csl4) [Imshaugia aleurites]|uniref:Exosome 3'->5 exonuclease subunit ski4 (Csl4) n=1 Tax=Imshaugia aleurites TaxID=172621 RepID=A0A8H3EJ10_9LECA|nr:exosome 3'->5 exonuclease subunit ski4 (Csl4) [Imshaugia aleurites]
MATTTTTLPPLAYPGLPLGSSTTYTSGPGTYLHVPTSTIHASLAGQPHLHPANASTSKPTLTIPRLLPSPTHAPIPSANISNANTLPRVGAVVLCRVVRVRTRQVDVVVLAVGRGEEEGGGEDVCGDEWQGVVRREDVRATEKEKVLCAEGFRVGDVVRGVVISLGDQSNYYLSTARNELGVIMAKSEAGNTMVPVSWKEFRDPVTGERESRKVAKPF